MGNGPIVGRGNELFKQLIELTGLPAEEIGKELKRLLKEKGIDPDFVTLDQLREVLAGYLQNTLKDFSPVKTTS